MVPMKINDHPPDGTLQAYLDGELADTPHAEVERHLIRCGRCRAELQLLRSAADQLSAALTASDVPAPIKPPAFAVAQPSRKLAPSGARHLLRAAALVLAVAGVAAAAAIPGSPLRDWLLRKDDGAATPAPAPPVEPVLVPAVEATRPESPPSGVSILPAEGEVRVILQNPDSGLRVRARLVDATRAEVVLVGEAAGARFRTGPGRIEVSDAGAGEIRIDLPLRLDVGSVEIDGRPYLVKEDEQLRVLAPSGDSVGAEVTFRVPF